LYNDKLCDFDSSPDIIWVIKEDEVGRACGTHWAERNAYRLLFGKPEVSWLVGRLGCRWEDNIEMNLRKIGWEGMDWIYLTQHRDKLWAVVNV
jgi:hypothetical protein